ncbi:uncharacterized protein [Struthio camelus]|uniref:uncharacterized protein n=1 Tax=Struthio camelus TaxID=8801 RepID=UPI0036040B6C
MLSSREEKLCHWHCGTGSKQRAQRRKTALEEAREGSAGAVPASRAAPDRLKVPQWTDGIWIEPLAVLMLGTYPSCSYLEALRSALNSKRTSRRPEAWVGTHEPSPSSQNKPTVQLKEIKTAVAPVVCTDSQWGGMEEGVILAVRFFLGASACLNRRVITQTPDAYAWGHRTVSVMALSYEHAWHGGCSNCNTLLLAAFNSHQISSACNACDCQIRPSVNTKTCKLSPNSWQSCSGSKFCVFGRHSDGRRAPRPLSGVLRAPDSAGPVRPLGPARSTALVPTARLCCAFLQACGGKHGDEVV